jgi:preprotein translocase subunit YajC
MLRSVKTTALRLFPLVGLVTFTAADAMAQTPQQPNVLMSTVFPIAVMLGVMYMLMIRPQVKKQKEHQAFLAALTRGSEVITTAGMLGRIEGLTDTHVTLEIAPNVRVKMVRSAIAGSAKPAPATGAEVKA